MISCSNIKPRSLFFISSFNRGGLETYLLRFISSSNKSFEKIIVVCKHGYGGDLEKEFKLFPNVEIIKLRLSYFNFLNYLKLLNILISLNVNSVCDFTGNFSGLTLFVSKIAGIKRRIVFYRGSVYQFRLTFPKKLYLKFITFLLTKSATVYLSNSEVAFNNFQPDWKKDNTQLYKVIFNGVPDPKLLQTNIVNRKSLGLCESDFVIGHVGSFRDAKNHQLILKIALVLVELIPNVKFLLLGHGVEEGLKNELIKNNLYQFFIIPGLRSDLFNWLPIIDLFLFPSKNEGQPNALIEAMLSSLPIVASDIPSVVECTHPSMNKYLHGSEDPVPYVNSILEICKNGCEYDVEEVRTWAKEKFNPELRFKEFLDVLL